MEQPTGFIQRDSNLVCWLKKSLYGLKQAPRAWHAKMDRFLLETGFSRCHSDNTIYTKKVGKSLIILVLYVDDLILTISDPNLINHVKSSLKKKFEMIELGHLHYFLGLQVLQSKEGISLSQSGMPVIFYSIFTWKTVSQPLLPFILEPNFQLLVLPLKLMLPYTINCAEASPLLVGFTDSDWAGDPDDWKSIAGYVFTLGLGPITRACKKQNIISLSSA
eukprot:PITA_15839